MNKLEFAYYYGTDAEQFRFLMVPKPILEEPVFASLSCEGVLLYSYMLDRMSLSRQNRWLDKENRVYIIFEAKNICTKLRCGEKKATKILKELSDIGLIQTKRQGLGKPNLYYVMNFVSVLDLQKEAEEAPIDGDFLPTSPEPPKTPFQNRQNDASGTIKTTGLDPSKEPSNKTNYNYTNFSDTDLYPSIWPSPPNLRDNENSIRPIDRLREQVKENIEYEILEERLDKGRLDEIVEIMVGILSCREPTYRLGQQEIDTALLKDRYLSLTCEHIEYVFACMDQTGSQIGNIKKYLETVLFNAPLTMESAVFAQFNHHFRQGD